MNRLPASKRAKILRGLLKRSSLSDVAENHDVSIKTVIKLLLDAGEVCGDYHDRTVRGVRSRRIQCDETYFYTYVREKNLPNAKSPPEYAGETWTWFAIDADTRLLVSWAVGPHTQETSNFFMEDLASRVDGEVQLTTDGLALYPPAVARAFGSRAHYAQLVKTHGSDPESTAGTVCGTPDPAHISTSYVERLNRTLRGTVQRHARRTEAYSKRIRNHARHIGLFAVWYNFIRRHMSLRTTPAMRAGLTDEWHDFDWLVDLIEAATPPPAPWGSRRRERLERRRQERIERGIEIGETRR